LGRGKGNPREEQLLFTQTASHLWVGGRKSPESINFYVTLFSLIKQRRTMRKDAFERPVSKYVSKYK